MVGLADWADWAGVKGQLLGDDGAGSRGALAALSGLGVQEKGEAASGAGASALLGVNIEGLISMLLASSAMLRFMPFKVLRVINCTSKACTLAPTALLFCSSQNITVLSS